VAIYRLLQGQAFDPEAVECLAAAYEAALKLLRISNTDDPITETIAQRIIEIAQTGVRDSAKLCAAALKGFDVLGGTPAYGCNIARRCEVAIGALASTACACAAASAAE
jgi:hypothetical protein